MQDENGRCGIATGTEKMVKADSKPVTAEQIRKALGQTLGADTAFLLRDVNTQCTLLAISFVPSCHGLEMLKSFRVDVG